MTSATHPPPEAPAAAASDDELLARVADGCGSAMSVLVMRHRGRVLRFAARTLGSHALAEEVAQEAFLRVYREAPAYRPQGRFLAWLLTIARNLSLNVLRSRARRPEVPLDEADAGRPPAPGMAELGVLRREVATALARLPERQRQALVLKAVEGHSYHEIARRLSIRETDVANAIFRARQRLARELGRS